MNTQEIKVTNAQTISVNAKMQDKIVIPSLEQQIVLPDENYNSLSKVVVEAVTLEDRIVYPNRDTQIITPNEALGLSSVTIEPVSLEEKSVVPTKEIQVLNPSDEVIGFSQVTVEKIPQEYIIPDGNLNITTNGDYEVTNNATVNVDVQPTLQDKTIEVKPTENKYIMPDEGYNGLGVVNVIGTIDTENVEVTPTKEVQTINRSEGKYIENVTVNPIPEDYIIPSGELEITENGSYDVTDKASVNVSTSGADLSEYFNTNPSEVTGGDADGGWLARNYLLKCPDVIIPNNVTKLNYIYTHWVGELLPKIICGDNVTNMANMFCQSPNSNQIVFNTKEIDLSGLNTSNVVTMNSMFLGCRPLTKLDLSNFDTSKVVNMNAMFYSCVGLTELDLSSFDTSNVTDMAQMFYMCTALTSIIGLNKFNTSRVTTMSSMFNYTNFTELDLSNFDTSNVTNMYQMFRLNTVLETLNIGSFDFSKVNNINDFFSSCSKLTNLTFGTNLGKGYTQKTTNYSYYKLNLSSCSLLTHDSAISVINGLYDLNLTYDVANGGTLYRQSLVFPTELEGVVTEDEILVATNRGWDISFA